MKPKLKLLGLYRHEVYDHGRRTGKHTIVLKLVTPANLTRDVELTPEKLQELAAASAEMLVQLQRERQREAKEVAELCRAVAKGDAIPHVLAEKLYALARSIEGGPVPE